MIWDVDSLVARAREVTIMECEPGGRTFQFVDGELAPARLVRQAVRQGKLIANGDGLLAGRTQTYRVA